ncbi:MAG: S9 family peptidase [candidate division KSB1 bacterium]|nr:S9 family peptidase [candidate division KSB1 bacterium]MDZ7274969.1 S9 family peptidase [candidate division KSB1 bacterium]MDZ7286580.1 S9 family peptidase [candidate division KSB1 bacterium]MDZ7299256.1 S9 family peptidase [candidate division KSB1 bacterium]MDZ7306084.1 S9 family peptidase [candidate division KSB1 bacterium]
MMECPGRFLRAAGMAALILAGSATAQPAPPLAARHPKVDTLHGEQRRDDYFWLREKDNPAVRQYLAAENAYAEKLLAFTKPLQEKLYQEMLGRIKETDLSVPYREGDYFYYSRTEQGRQYPIYCRKAGSLAAPEEITLDLNQLARGRVFLGLGAYAVSDDGNLLAYAIDTTGFRVYDLQIKDLRTGELLPDRAHDVGSVFWAADNRTLFYVTKDAAKRPYRLHRHVLGSQPELLYEEQDERFSLWGGRTRSQAYLIVYSASLTSTEARFISAGAPHSAWQILLPRRPDRQFEIEHHGDRFYIRVNDAGRNFRLVSAPVSDPGEKNWQEIVPHRQEVMLEGIDCFARHYVLYERHNGLEQIRITDLQTGVSHYLAFPEAVYTAAAGTNRVWDTPTLRYHYQSLITPGSVYDYDMTTRTSTLLKQTEVRGGYDKNQYRCERLFATARDGTRIPISIVYKKGFKKNGRAPLLLNGYGAYGYAYDAGFNSNRLSLLDRGFAVAIAHIRGGGELGKAWHDQGRMQNKMNTFTDFIACAEFLIAQKFTARDKLIIEGGSAGGLLMGAVTNLRPDLFKAVVSHVPFVDVINTMLDESLPLTVAEFEEWGNPRKPEEYAWLRQYCPYTNLAAKAYPAMLLKTAFNDSQVMYWEPAKYVAKLRRLKTDRNPLVFVINMGAGHGGASGRYDRLREIALDYAFMLWQAGVVQPPQ